MRVCSRSPPHRIPCHRLALGGTVRSDLAQSLPLYVSVCRAGPLFASCRQGPGTALCTLTQPWTAACHTRQNGKQKA